MASRTAGLIPAKAQPDENITPEMRTRFRDLSKMPYAEQAKWYLNGFWTQGAEQQAEEVWNTVETFIKMDKKKKLGNELNEVEAHHFLQSSGKTMTALELRNALRKIDIDANGMMGVLEYVLFQYQRKVADCLNNPQGGSEESKRLEEAQAQLDAMNVALADLQVQLEQQRDSEAKAKAAEEALTRAEEEARAASAEFQRQEDEYKSKIVALEAKSTDQSIGTVSRNKAVQELAQLKGEDPLPLRRAKITQEAAVRKVAAERKVAEAARVKAEEQTKVVEAAVADTEAKAAATMALLEELKRAAAVPFGAIWWMQREVTEAKKYMPKSKQ